MKRFKKQFLAAVLIAALSAAVYLNWSLTSDKSVSKTIGESKYVNATLSTSAASPDEKPKKSYSKLTAKQKKFFASAKTKRNQTQDKIIDEASEILALESTPQDEMTRAQSQVAGIIKNFTLQDSIETTLNAKGFTSCLCYLNDEGCTVTVLKKELNSSSSMVIKATVKSATNMDFDKITIVTV